MDVARDRHVGEVHLPATKDDVLVYDRAAYLAGGVVVDRSTADHDIAGAADQQHRAHHRRSHVGWIEWDEADVATVKYRRDRGRGPKVEPNMHRLLHRKIGLTAGRS